MQYVEYVKLAIAVLSILSDIAEDVKAGGADSDSKKLIASELRAFVKKIHDLKKK